MKSPNKEEIMKRIKEAGDPENYETSWNKAGTFTVSKFKPNIIKGRKSKSKGSSFELKIRKDLENKGRIIDKWTNNIDLKQNKLISSKKIFNPFKKIMVPGAGFPDFISIKYISEGSYSVIGVEVKTNGMLSKIEKQKCAWYLQNKIFSQIWIAKIGEKRGEIIYEDFKEKHGNKYNNL